LNRLNARAIRARRSQAAISAANRLSGARFVAARPADIPDVAALAAVLRCAF